MIYSYAISAVPAATMTTVATPPWVKNNAIFLISIIPTLDEEQNVHFTYLEPNDSDRVDVALKAANMNPYVETCNFRCYVISKFFFDFILYLQAYDALKAVGYYCSFDKNRFCGFFLFRRILQWPLHKHTGSDNVVSGSS